MAQHTPSANLPASVMAGLKDVDEAAHGHRVLGAISYSAESTDPVVVDGRVELGLHMTSTPDDGFSEIWTTRRPVEAGEHNGVVYAHDGETLLCAGRIATSGEYTAATRAAYLTALGLMRELDYPTCFRMWNFVEGINADNAEGLEVYRDFCRGRAEAFELAGVGDGAVPAATGIGSQGGGIAFYFTASRSLPVTSVENPLQVSAYHYPPVYGPRAPKFARATHLGEPDGGQLYVAGTASIRGHETLHVGDVERQTRLALENIALVIGRENLAAHGLDQGHTLADLDNIKVYIRRREDIPVVRRICDEAFSPSAEIAFLNVDICRADLLVEIEGIVSPSLREGVPA